MPTSQKRSYTSLSLGSNKLTKSASVGWAMNLDTRQETWHTGGRIQSSQISCLLCPNKWKLPKIAQTSFFFAQAKHWRICSCLSNLFWANLVYLKACEHGLWAHKVPRQTCHAKIWLGTRPSDAVLRQCKRPRRRRAGQARQGAAALVWDFWRHACRDGQPVDDAFAARHEHHHYCGINSSWWRRFWMLGCK